MTFAPTPSAKLLGAFDPGALRGAVPIITLVALWGVGAQLGWINPLILPPLPEVLRAFVDPANAAPLWGGLAASFLRLLLGAAGGIVLGLAAGALMGLSPTAEKLIGPSFHAFRQVALFAWIPLLTAWLGAGDTAKITFVVLAAFKPVTMATFEGFRGVPRHYLEVGRAMCFSRRRTLVKITVPAALPAIVGGLQLGLIYGWMAAIGAEYLMGGVAPGIGAFVIAGRERLAMDQVYVGIITIAAVGLILNKALRWSGARALRWKGEAA
jgi:sulfonate transport system permease protein